MTGAQGTPKTTHPVRIGIVGFGQIGRTHVDALKSCPDAQVVAISRRKPSSGDLGIGWRADYQELLHRPDGDLVAICTPSGDHAPQALAALEAGKGVVVEKPLAVKLTDGDRVVRTVRDRGLFLSVISRRRTEPACRYLHEGILAGKHGRPLRGEALVRWHRDQRYYDSAPWRGPKAMEGGILMNQAIHAIDLLGWLFGPIAEVSGTTAMLARRIEAEDTAVATLRFASGALGAIIATTATSPGLPAELNPFWERGLVSLHDASVVRWEAPGLPPPPRTCSPAAGAPTRLPSGASAISANGRTSSPPTGKGGIRSSPAKTPWQESRPSWPSRKRAAPAARSGPDTPLLWPHAGKEPHDAPLRARRPPAPAPQLLARRHRTPAG